MAMAEARVHVTKGPRLPRSRGCHARERGGPEKPRASASPCLPFVRGAVALDARFRGHDKKPLAPPPLAMTCFHYTAAAAPDRFADVRVWAIS
jgi:hypothetical protein